MSEEQVKETLVESSGGTAKQAVNLEATWTRVAITTADGEKKIEQLLIRGYDREGNLVGNMYVSLEDAESLWHMLTKKLRPAQSESGG